MTTLLAEATSDQNSLIAVGTVVGAVIGWVIGIVQKNFEIKKLENEIIKLIGEHLSKVQAARSEYSKAAAECTKAVSELIKSLQAKDATDIVDLKREAVCAAILDVTIPKYLDHVEWEHLDCKSDSHLLKRLIDDEVIPELARFTKWMSVINTTHLITHIKRNPAEVSKRKVSAFRKIARSLDPADHTVYYARLDAAIDALCEQPQNKAVNRSGG